MVKGGGSQNVSHPQPSILAPTLPHLQWESLLSTGVEWGDLPPRSIILRDLAGKHTASTPYPAVPPGLGAGKWHRHEPEKMPSFSQSSDSSSSRDCSRKVKVGSALPALRPSPQVPQDFWRATAAEHQAKTSMENETNIVPNEVRFHSQYKGSDSSLVHILD